MALWVENATPTKLNPHATEGEDDLQLVINSAYKQVLGNMHVMDSMRMTSAESLLRDGQITVRGFVRAIAKSDLYRAAFFETSSSYRFIELNFKHLLGRAPQDQSEIAEHVATYNTQGYDAEIDSYLDSAEYLASFGEDIVPYVRGAQSQVGYKNVNFNRTFALVRGDATSDRGRSARLIGSVAGNLTSKIAAPRGGSGAYSNTGKRFRIAVSTSAAAAAINRTSNQEYLVSYNQMSKTIQNVLKRGGKIVSINEAGY